MLTHNDLKKGALIIIDKEPYEVLEVNFLKKAQRRPTVQTKIRNLITGSVLPKNFHQGDAVEEAEIFKFKVKFLYSHRSRFFFSKEEDPSRRFDLSEDQIGLNAQFLKTGETIDAQEFENSVINISLPIKVRLKVKEAPPGARGDRAQSGTKIVILETGAKINVPLFVKEGDTIEVNTEKGEYVQRVQ